MVQDLARLPRDKQPLGQVLIELHGIQRLEKIVHLMSTMESLGYRLFHAEDNPYCLRCYEVAFIHESLVDPRLAGGATEGEPPARRQEAALTEGERQHCASVLASQAQGALAAQRRRRAKRFGDPLDRKKARWQAALSQILIPEYSCPWAQRLGKWGLGGKWVCHSAIEGTPASPRGTVGRGEQPSGSSGGGRRRVGIVTVEKRNTTEDLSFERDACLQLNATVYLFDPALPPRLKGDVQSKLSNCIVLRTRSLSAARKVSFRKKRLGRSVAAVGAVPRLVGLSYIDILSTNCMGCEHEVVAELASLYGAKTVPYGQLLIQLHGARDVVAVTGLLSKIQRLGYLMFHVDRIDRVGTVYEIAFVHHSRVHAVKDGKVQA